MPVPREPAGGRGDGGAFEGHCAALGPRLMRDLGLSAVQAAGLLGNLGHESGGFRFLQEIRPAVPGSRGGWGLAQWTGPRRVAMEAWCRANRLDPAAVEASYGYLCVELRGPEAAALRALRATRTLRDATRAFMRHFERPGVEHLPSRVAWAERALRAIAAAPATVPRGADPANPEPAGSAARTPT